MYVYKPRRGLKRGEESKVCCGSFLLHLLCTWGPGAHVGRALSRINDLILCDITPGRVSAHSGVTERQEFVRARAQIGRINPLAPFVPAGDLQAASQAHREEKA